MFTPRRTAVLLMLVTAALYARTLGFGFVYEDLNDPEAFFRDGQGFTGWFSDALVKPFRSLTALSVVMNQAVFGERNPVGFHAANVALHLVNGALLYALARRLMTWGAVVAVGLFWLHPIQVESVAYVSARPDLVSTLCVLVALLCVERGSVLGAFLACGAAVLGKETAIVAYLLIPAWAYVRGYQWDWSARLAWGVFLAIPAGALLVHYPIQVDGLYAGEQLAALSRLLLLVVIPVGFTIDHDWTVITPQVVLLVASAWVVALSIACEKNWPYWSQALLWSVLCVAPRFVVPLVEGLHEHHLYLPMIGLSLCAGLMVSDDARRMDDGIRASGIPA